MKMKNISYGLLAGLLLGACSGGVYEETGNGVIVKVQQKEDRGARLVRLQVMGEKLIRVSATPEGKFADPQSLIIVPGAEQTPFPAKPDYCSRSGTNAVYGGSAGRYRYGVYRRGACLGVGIDRRGMVYR